MMRPIAISLSPNTQIPDVFAALRLILMPWRYTQGNAIKLLEQWMRTTYGVSYAVSFTNGRSALFAILKSLDIQKGDEVILQPFTCVAVVNAVIWAGATPVYVDITQSFGFDLKKLEKNISKKTRAIIVQYTFGIPQDIETICKIAKKQKIAVIEDCAHVLGADLPAGPLRPLEARSAMGDSEASRQELGKKLGTFGDAALFSFGRDKAFSSVFGGIAITNDQQLGKKIRTVQKGSAMPSYRWTLQQLFHPVAFSFILPLYNVLSIGKGMLIVLQKLRLLSFPYTHAEKRSDISGLSVQKMPNALCTLAMIQLKRLKQYNKTREECTAYYSKHLQTREHVTLPWTTPYPLLRYPILVANPDLIHKSAKKQGIYLGTWYSSIIDPKGTNREKVGYALGSCPQAEYLAAHIVNLPTYPTLKKRDASRVLSLLATYV